MTWQRSSDAMGQSRLGHGEIAGDPGAIPASMKERWLRLWDGEWGARTKGRFEVKLQNLVCKGEVSLQLARAEIGRSWVAAYGKDVGLGQAGLELTEPIE